MTLILLVQSASTGTSKTIEQSIPTIADYCTFVNIIINKNKSAIVIFTPVNNSKKQPTENHHIDIVAPTNKQLQILRQNHRRKLNLAAPRQEDHKKTIHNSLRTSAHKYLTGKKFYVNYALYVLVEFALWNSGMECSKYMKLTNQSSLSTKKQFE